MTDTFRFQDPRIEGRIYHAVYDDAAGGNGVTGKASALRMVSVLGAVSFGAAAIAVGVMAQSLAGGALAALFLLVGIVFAIQAWGWRRPGASDWSGMDGMGFDRNTDRGWDNDQGRSDRPRW